MTNPHVSVILPVRNSAKTLLSTIESVKAQTHQDWTLFVLVDPSEDDTVGVARAACSGERRANVIVPKTEMGLASTLNLASEFLGHGDIVARIDGDTTWTPRHLDAGLAVMLKEDADLCFSGYRWVGETGETLAVNPPPLKPHVMRWRGLFHNAYGAHPGVMFRRMEILEVGNYDKTMFFCEDYDLWVRCDRAGLKFVHTPFQSCVMLSHPGQKSRDTQAIRFEREISYKQQKGVLGIWDPCAFEANRWTFTPHGGRQEWYMEPIVGMRILDAWAENWCRDPLMMRDIYGDILNIIPSKIKRAHSYVDRIDLAVMWARLAARARGESARAIKNIANKLLDKLNVKIKAVRHERF